MTNTRNFITLAQKSDEVYLLFIDAWGCLSMPSCCISKVIAPHHHHRACHIPAIEPLPSHLH